MTLLRDLRRSGARVLAPLVAVAALLVACGGGTEQVQSFAPARLLVLGDENSMLVDDGAADGFKYSVNDRRGTTAGKCLLLPTFSQQVAAYYGFVFSACNPTAATAKAFTHARLRAQVDDATDGLQAQLAAISGLGGTDLVMLMIGSQDMVRAYEQVRDGSLTEAQAMAAVETAGGSAAAAVNAILATGARALVITVPDLGLSPYAVAQELVFPGAKALLSRLAAGTSSRSGGFNTALRIGIDAGKYDGRNYGLVLADDVVAAIVRFPTSFLGSPANVLVAACSSATAATCQLTDSTTTSTLVTGASTNTHLWASDRHLGPVAHAQIGSQALSRAVNNPF